MEKLYSLVIPTNNRPEFVKRFLKYYHRDGFSGEVVVVDGSDDEGVAANLKVIGRFRDLGMTIHHTVERDPYPFVREEFRWGAGFSGRLCRGLELVTTPFVQMMCDDDFATVEYMEAASAFLAAHPDYSMVMGRVASIYLEDGNQAFGPVARVACTQQLPPRTEDKGVERLIAGERMVFPYPRTFPQTILALTRTEVWREVAKTSEAFHRATIPAGEPLETSADSTLFTLYYMIDVAHAFHCFAGGKIHSCPEVMSVRHFHASNEGGGGRWHLGVGGRQSFLVDSLCGAQWGRMVQAATEPVVAILAERDGVQPEFARDVVRTCLLRQVAHMLDHVIGHRLVALSGEPGPRTPFLGRVRKVMTTFGLVPPALTQENEYPQGLLSVRAVIEGPAD